MDENAENGVPLELRRFRAQEWGGGPDAAQRFFDALDEWAEAGNDMPPEWPDEPLPDVAWDPEWI